MLLSPYHSYFTFCINFQINILIAFFHFSYINISTIAGSNDTALFFLSVHYFFFQVVMRRHLQYLNDSLRQVFKHSVMVVVVTRATKSLISFFFFNNKFYWIYRVCWGEVGHYISSIMHVDYRRVRF